MSKYFAALLSVLGLFSQLSFADTNDGTYSYSSTCKGVVSDGGAIQVQIFKTSDTGTTGKLFLVVLEVNGTSYGVRGTYVRDVQTQVTTIKSDNLDLIQIDNNGIGSWYQGKYSPSIQLTCVSPGNGR